MRVHIISDMEGVSGIVKCSRRAAAIRCTRRAGASTPRRSTRPCAARKAAGATEIVVMDCHGAGGGWTFNSLIPEKLDPDCEFVVQDEWTEYTAFLESGCDAALFVGMHALNGVRFGVLNHTCRGRNGRTSGSTARSSARTGINAALCGHWGVPVLLVTGDSATCDEGRALLGDGLTTVSVKEGLGRYSARQIAPLRARELIEAGAKQALSDLTAVKPYDPGSPCTIEVEYKISSAVDKLRRVPGVEVVDDRRIRVHRRHVVGRLAAVLLSRLMLTTALR